MTRSRRLIPYAFRVLAVVSALLGIAVSPASHDLGVELVIAALVFAQLGGAFPTVRPDASRELERLIDEGREAVGKLATYLSLFETSAAIHGKHEAELERVLDDREDPPS